MRRFWTPVAAGLLIAALTPATTIAAPPVRELEEQTSLTCVSLSGDAGTARVSAFLGAEESFGSLTLWTTGDPESTEPDVVTFGSSLDWDGLTLTATFELFEFVEPPDPEEPPVPVPAGTASFSATLAPEGRPQVLVTFLGHDGNRVTHIEESFQPRSVEGTLLVDLLAEPVASYDMSTCSASTSTLSSSTTDPTARVNIESSLFITCAWETPDGGVTLAALADHQNDLQVTAGETLYFGLGESLLTMTAFEAEFTLIDLITGEEVGAASASATLTRVQPLKGTEATHDSMVRQTGWLLSVEGSLSVTTPTGTAQYAMDEASCLAVEAQTARIRTDPSGPRLKNDDPSDAIALTLGQTASVWTGASTTEPEAPCVGGGPFSNSISHTGWWTFVGTGGDVTIDTAGSSFDTILGVYLPVGDGFEEVGCADDLRGPDGELILQAALTLGTTAGTTYYLQVGGFGPNGSGDLVLAID